MPKTRLQKETAVQILTDRVQKSGSLVFADYKGMTMSELDDLRGKLAEVSSEFNVTKNNLLKIALKNSQLEVKDPTVFEGPIATLFAFGEEITPIKILTEAIKKNQKGSIKGGFIRRRGSSLINGEALDESQVNKLASLPSRDQLRAQVVGALGSPLYGIVGVLQANLRNLVYALDQVRLQKGGETA